MTNEHESWIATNWRPLCGVVYLLICFTDFCALPIYHTVIQARYTPDRIYDIVKNMEGAGQIEAMRALREQQSWKPVTLEGAGLFHVAFGAILGVAAWTRGTERIERTRGEMAIATEQARNATNGHG